jgi:hypothetical protein
MPLPNIVRKLPFFEQPTMVAVPGGMLTIKPYQILVWVSIAERSRGSLAATTPFLPALLDTGLNFNFALREEHVLAWAGLPPQALVPLGHARLSGVPANLLDADVWLVRNQPGQRDLHADLPPFRLELHRGIAVLPRATSPAPRLPLLGLRRLRRANLQLTVDCRACQVSLWMPRRFWFFS